jgi:hypothetical protein
VEDGDVLHPDREFGEPLRSPAPKLGPLGQLTTSDEGDAWRMPGEPGPELGGKAVAQGQRRHIGVENDEAHACPALREA